ncbi:putative replication factor C, subunit 4 [Leishmania mexicana MHOM/GT/2001/U1103]|uniref:Replication factor C, subunit 4 n=1 Tax=Leishmania mexicana (strain MHOM/GT/2001/U1103) TaxID=929439 RepID=E9AYV6_LEIMU|nr:putative replication factor C, subunit 4 [Leishmania mexicana MHOM/GT/2001/U1103]CBZ28150.1 putative replication factor C, subunit 4 [Leishmania mexicana MHOM/GT/2001/U1103]
MSTVNTPWVEKYRPQTVADIVGNTEAISRLQVIAKEGNLPNLLLCGPPGTGKTTSMLCLARDLLLQSTDAGSAGASPGGATKDILKDAVLELNASDDRGLDVVREKIKLFAQTKKTLPKKFFSTGEGVAKDDHVVHLHKIVLLDEADSMTPAAQQALRRTMELHSSTTRFAFACNNSSKIIEPIQSRCAVVRFKKLSDADILKRLVYVIQQENVSYTDDGLEALLYLAEGDLRQALNALQATHTGYGLVNADNVFKVCDQPHPLLVENVITACVMKRNIEEAHREMNRLLNRGYAPVDVIATFFKVVQTNARLFRSELQQLEVLKIVGETTMRIAEGVGTPLQLAAMLARMIAAVENNPS